MKFEKKMSKSLFYPVIPLLSSSADPKKISFRLQSVNYETFDVPKNADECLVFSVQGRRY
jgi:hypothetical protein